MSTFEMQESVTVSLSPNWPNIMYEVTPRSEPEADFSDLLSTIWEKLLSTPHVIVYYQTLMTCADLFAHFSYEIGSDQYYPTESSELSDNGLSGMFHARIPQHSKDVIVNSRMGPCEVVRNVLVSVVMGKGVDLQGVNTTIHYGAPSSLEDYFQASGRAGRSCDPTRSIAYWTLTNCPRRKDPCTSHHHEVIDVRAYLENSTMCRCKWLMEYFDPMSAKPESHPLSCCDVCAATSRNVTS